MELKQEHIILQNNLRRFVQREVEPFVVRIDRDNYFPRELGSKLSDMGLLGILVPEEYGGSGFDTTSFGIALEEIARMSGSLALLIGAHNGLVITTLLSSGSEDLKKKYLPQLAQGQKLGGFCLESESSLTLSGRKVSGRARFVLGGGAADILILPVNRNNEKIYFLIESSTPGIRIRKREDMMGMRGSGIADIDFDEALLEESAIFNPQPVEEVAAIFNVGMAAIGVGLCQSALDASLKYSKERHQFGQAICNFDMVQDMLAEMALRTHTSRLLLYDASFKRDNRRPFVKEALMAKIYAAQSATLVTRYGVQIHGGYGYTKDYPIERMFRDAKATEVIGGISEEQRLSLAKGML
ncbi:MAG: acyl-CoA dehydrogenase family protein [candidate division WOR-3 bacterium]